MEKRNLHAFNNFRLRKLFFQIKSFCSGAKKNIYIFKQIEHTFGKKVTCKDSFFSRDTLYLNLIYEDLKLEENIHE